MELVTQIVPVPLAVGKIPGKKSSAPYELVFMAKGIPALGYQSFYVSVKTQEGESEVRNQEPFKSENSWSGDGNVSKKQSQYGDLFLLDVIKLECINTEENSSKNFTVSV